MKTYLLIISIVFLCVISFAQKKEIEDPIYSVSSKKLEKTSETELSNFKVVIDDFTNAKLVSQIQPLPLFQKGSHLIWSHLFKKDDQCYLYFTFSNEDYSIICTNDKSNVMLKFTSGDVITLNHIGNIECENLISISVELTAEDLKKLSENQIEKIRCNHSKGYEDFEIYDVVPKNSWNKQQHSNFVDKSPKLEFINLINEIQKL